MVAGEQVVYCSACFFSVHECMEIRKPTDRLLLVVFQMLKNEGAWNHWILENSIASDSRTLQKVLQMQTSQQKKVYNSEFNEGDKKPRRRQRV